MSFSKTTASGPVGQPRFPYGSSFVDGATGIRFVGYHPTTHPDEWQYYLACALESYRIHNVEGVLNPEAVVSGEGVGLFILGYNQADDIVAGIRYHGPLQNCDDTALMREMAAAPDIENIRDVVEHACSAGAIEVKGLWSLGEKSVGVKLLATMARINMVAIEWLGVEYALATVADRMLVVRDFIGAIQIGHYAVAFPNESYRTVLVASGRMFSRALCDPAFAGALASDLTQLDSQRATG